MCFLSKLRKLFETPQPPPKQLMKCCYCARPIPVDSQRCGSCKNEVDGVYRQRHARARPLYVPIAGWSAVGKTVWLMALLVRIYELNFSSWRKFTYFPVNSESTKFQEKLERAIDNGETPAATPLGVHEAYAFMLLNLPLWGGRTLVVRDVAGENFDQVEIPREQVGFLRDSNTSFFMYSLADLDQPGHKRMDALLRRYLIALNEFDPGLAQRQRRVIVILSKADLLIRGRYRAPDNLIRYVVDDPLFLASSRRQPTDALADGESLDNYLKRLDRVNKEIRDWLEGSVMQGGAQLTGLAHEFNIDLRFTLVSSLGSDPENGQALWNARRVLDPLFWALQLDKDRS